MEHSELISRIRLIRTPTIGPITSRQLISRYGNAKQTLEAIPELSSRGGPKIHPASEASAQREFEKLTQIGGYFIVYGSDSYPERSKRFDDSHFILSCLGHMHSLKKPSLSIIEARNASLNSCNMPREYHVK